jgi:hypothetical protein
MVSTDFFAFVIWFGLSIYHGARYVGGGGDVSKAINESQTRNTFVWEHFCWSLRVDCIK